MQAVLDVGYLRWTNFRKLLTPRCSMLFRSLIDIPRVKSSSTCYRNPFSYVASMRWGVEVTKFGLSPEQSQVVFAFVDLLQGVYLVQCP